jgi:hypothetical protein
LSAHVGQIEKEKRNGLKEANIETWEDMRKPTQWLPFELNAPIPRRFGKQQMRESGSYKANAVWIIPIGVRGLGVISAIRSQKSRTQKLDGRGGLSPSPMQANAGLLHLIGRFSAAKRKGQGV